MNKFYSNTLRVAPKKGVTQMTIVNKYKDEDEQLDKCNNKEDSGFKLLLRFKGEERVKRRIIYRKLNKNFLL